MVFCAVFLGDSDTPLYTFEMEYIIKYTKVLSECRHAQAQRQPSFTIFSCTASSQISTRYSYRHWRGRTKFIGQIFMTFVVRWPPATSRQTVSTLWGPTRPCTHIPSLLHHLTMYHTQILLNTHPKATNCSSPTGQHRYLISIPGLCRTYKFPKFYDFTSKLTMQPREVSINQLQMIDVTYV